MRIYIAAAAALTLFAVAACEDDHSGHAMPAGDADAATAMDGHTMETAATDGTSTAADGTTTANDATATTGDGMTMDGAHMGGDMGGGKMDM